jgi:hypothetical protein
MSFRIRGIEESWIYQEALRKGEALGEARVRAQAEARARAEEVRTILILQGRKKFGPPDEQAEAKLAAVSDLSRLHELGARILDVTSWDELLAESQSESA